METCEKTAYQGMRDAHFMQKRADSKGAGMRSWNALLTRSFSKQPIEECGDSFKLEDGAAACVHGVGKFHVSLGWSSESESKPYALGSEFQLSDSGSGLKETRRGVCAINNDEDVFGGPHGKVEKFEVRLFSCTIEYVCGMDCDSDTSGETVCP